ncbi:hypothetical protein AVEN_230997-1 [Araneus ventricosus]|uniref:Uncharacterized protein n=1 Tax=Araneus ventricosus TaxID=182803 RepID=A0A4Y2A3I4_ARAVE|nr:hypothetical protein AVEN_230997-1 [Araneus ventricosus]
MKTFGGLTHGRGVSDSVLASWTQGMTALQHICYGIEKFCGVDLTSSTYENLTTYENNSQPFSMKWPSGVPLCMATTWSTTYVVEKCDVMWKLPHPVLTGGSERQLRKLTFGNDLSNYNVD